MFLIKFEGQNIIFACELPLVPRVGEEIHVWLNPRDRNGYKRVSISGKVLGVRYICEDSGSGTYRFSEKDRYHVIIDLDVYPPSEGEERLVELQILR